jgi:hypothetical protein
MRSAACSWQTEMAEITGMTDHCRAALEHCLAVSEVIAEPEIASGKHLAELGIVSIAANQMPWPRLNGDAHSAINCASQHRLEPLDQQFHGATARHQWRSRA